MSFSARLLGSWYASRPKWFFLGLAPFTGLFILVSAVRRFAFRCGWLSSKKLPVPVVVVGNITVGGAGKTPLTRALVQALRAQGWTPGIISRGYGRAARDVCLVAADSTPDAVGDEPLLLAREGAPVAVGADRVQAGQLLLRQHPEVDVILTDDGLQHYRLQRDIEIVVVESARGLGNGWRLPLGPLRESRHRLAQVNAVVIHGDGAFTAADVPATTPCFQMELVPSDFYSLHQPSLTCQAEQLRSQDCAAVAGIAHPERFFNTLKTLGLQPRCFSFPDHHAFQASDLPAAQAVLVTEKDAVKLQTVKNVTLWVLPVSAAVRPDLGLWLDHTLRTLKHGQQTS